MPIIDTLLTAAYEDTQLLIKNDALGDDFSVPRDVDFVLRTKEKEKAETISLFVQDNQYGVPRIEEVEGDFRIVVTIHMPITQQVLCSVSGLMGCLSEIFGAEYDGWGCVIQRHT
ncbi:hypothetical protein DLREEDagrD3_10900 [Denitratisoma sp. agr-D3]